MDYLLSNNGGMPLTYEHEEEEKEKEEDMVLPKKPHTFYELYGFERMKSRMKAEPGNSFKPTNSSSTTTAAATATVASIPLHLPVSLEAEYHHRHHHVSHVDQAILEQEKYSDVFVSRTVKRKRNRKSPTSSRKDDETKEQHEWTDGRNDYEEEDDSEEDEDSFHDPLDIHAYDRPHAQLPGATPQHYFLSHGGSVVPGAVGVAASMMQSATTTSSSAAAASSNEPSSTHLLTVKMRSRASKSLVGQRMDSLWFIEREAERKWIEQCAKDEEVNIALEKVMKMDSAQLATAALPLIIHQTAHRIRDIQHGTKSDESEQHLPAPPPPPSSSPTDFYPPSSSIQSGIGMTAHSSSILNAQIPYLADMVVAAAEGLDQYDDGCGVAHNLTIGTESIVSATEQKHSRGGAPVNVIARRRIDGAPAAGRPISAKKEVTERNVQKKWGAGEGEQLMKVVDPVPKLMMFRVRNVVDGEKRVDTMKTTSQTTPSTARPLTAPSSTPSAPSPLSLSTSIRPHSSRFHRARTCTKSPLQKEIVFDEERFTRQKYLRGSEPTMTAKMNTTAATSPQTSRVQPPNVEFDNWNDANLKYAASVVGTTTTSSPTSSNPSSSASLVHIRPWSRPASLRSTQHSHYMLASPSPSSSSPQTQGQHPVQRISSFIPPIRVRCSDRDILPKRAYLKLKSIAGDYAYPSPSSTKAVAAPPRHTMLSVDEPMSGRTSRTPSRPSSGGMKPPMALTSHFRVRLASTNAAATITATSSDPAMISTSTNSATKGSDESVPALPETPRSILLEPMMILCEETHQEPNEQELQLAIAGLFG